MILTMQFPGNSVIQVQKVLGKIKKSQNYRRRSAELERDKDFQELLAHSWHSISIPLVNPIHW
jgi:hypothetical protein